MTYSIGELCQAFGLSRSTLIYYDKLALLTPSTRSKANYRVYTEQDYQRLIKIMAFRSTGMSLLAITKLLNEPCETSRIGVLENHIEELNKEIQRLRKQQQVTIELLQTSGIDLPAHSVNEEQWQQLLESTDISNEDMWQWHTEFESRKVKAHQNFLESLNIPIK